MDTPISAIKPDLQTSLVCDDVRQEINGKFIIIGIFERLMMGEFPGVFARFNIVNRWCSGVGEYTQVTKIICPDGTSKLIEGRQVPVKLQSELAVATSVECFVNVRFPAPGTYWVEIYLDHELKLRYPFIVEQRKQKQ